MCGWDRGWRAAVLLACRIKKMALGFIYEKFDSTEIKGRIRGKFGDGGGCGLRLGGDF
jgi:hypothetical protein